MDNNFGGQSIPLGAILSDTQGDFLGDESPIDGGEIIQFGSIRQTPINLKFKPNHEYNPVRDALMLRVLLSTSLHPDTWNELVRDIILNTREGNRILTSLLENPQIRVGVTKSQPNPAIKKITTKKSPKSGPSDPKKQDEDI